MSILLHPEQSEQTKTCLFDFNWGQRVLLRRVQAPVFTPSHTKIFILTHPANSPQLVQTGANLPDWESGVNLGKIFVLYNPSLMCLFQKIFALICKAILFSQYLGPHEVISILKESY